MKSLEKFGLGILVILLVTLSSLLVFAFITPTTTQETNQQSSSTLTTALNNPAAQVTTQQARAIALQVVQGTVTDVELERNNGLLTHVVEVEADNKEYNIKINAQTGKVVMVEEESELGVQELELIESSINKESAKQIALSQVPGTVKEIEIEKINNKQVYEVEILKDNREFEVVIDLMSGTVLEVNEEIQKPPLTPTSTNALSFNTGTTITQSQAIDIAKQSLSSSYHYDEIEMDSYHGETVYVVDFEGGSMEAEVTVSLTGEVLNIFYEEDD